VFVLQWLFVLEGLPSVVMGVVVYFVLPDSYKVAPWLSEREKALLAADVSGWLLTLCAADVNRLLSTLYMAGCPTI
jgi:hypothetical protein